MSQARRTPLVRLTQRELNRYRVEVDSAADAAGDYIMDVMDAFFRVYPDADTAAARNLVIEALQLSLPNFCDAAATLSADLFDEIAEALGVDVETQLYDTIDYDKVEQKVRYFAKFLNEGDSERFKQEVADVTRYYVKRSAFDNMRENCKGQEIKWARVPTGFETCAFCFMLASRGFVYGNERIAGKDRPYHPNCDCIIIPGFEDENGNPRVKIDGYDPQAMYENWCKCAETVGIDTGDGLTKLSEADVKAIQKEVETRDWHWLYTGEEPKIDYSRSPRSEYGDLRSKSEKFNPSDYDESNVVNAEAIEWRDMFAHDALANNGFRIVTRESKAFGKDGKIIEGVTTPDIEIDGVIWEIKSVRNGEHKPKNELSFIEQTIRDARENFKNPYDAKSKNGMGDMRTKTKVVINTRYRSINATEKEISEEFAKRAERYNVEVIWVDAKGSVRRFG